MTTHRMLNTTAIRESASPTAGTVYSKESDVSIYEQAFGKVMTADEYRQYREVDKQTLQRQREKELAAEQKERDRIRRLKGKKKEEAQQLLEEKRQQRQRELDERRLTNFRRKDIKGLEGVKITTVSGSVVHVSTPITQALADKVIKGVAAGDSAKHISTMLPISLTLASKLRRIYLEQQEID